MSKQLFANEKVMKQYLDALLFEDAPATVVQPVENLLQDVEAKVKELQQERIVKEEIIPEKAPLITPAKPAVEIENEEKSAVLVQEESFQADTFDALFFEVAGLTLAVPLKSLGGIHQVGEITSLFGKPDWFNGVMLNRDEKLSAVDTARWVMPEKYNKNLEQALNYQYLIMLGGSHWGLLAENLVDNVKLTHDDVKWRESSGKRPWLAGLIKEKMCALVNVTAMIDLLEQGLDSRDYEQET